MRKEKRKRKKIDREETRKENGKGERQGSAASKKNCEKKVNGEHGSVSGKGEGGTRGSKQQKESKGGGNGGCVAVGMRKT